MEGLALAHLAHGLVHGGDDRGRERLGDVADAEPDHAGVGMLGLIRADAPADLRKQVRSGKLGVMLGDARHVGGR